MNAKTLAAGVLSLSFSTLLMAADYQAGKDYFEIANPVQTSDPAKVEVAEYFGYWCPHCNNFEPILNKWAAGLPADIVVDKESVAFSSRDPNQLMAQKGYYIAEQMGKVKEVSPVIFDYYHRYGRMAGLFDNLDQMKSDPVACSTSTREAAEKVASRQNNVSADQIAVILNTEICGGDERAWQILKLAQDNRSRIRSENTLEELFKIAGVNTNNFAKRAKSFSIDSLIQKGNSKSETIGIDSVPTLVINGKYRVTASSASGFEGMLKVAAYLIDKERAAAQ